MIKYKLHCKKCLDNFDSWFSTSLEFDKIKKLNLLICNSCGSSDVIKSLMSPSLKNTKKKRFSKKLDKNFKNKIKKYQKFIKENFDYVGENFAFEARSIHYNNKNNKKAIYGKASIKDVNELNEEGIKTSLIPWINDKEN